MTAERWSSRAGFLLATVGAAVGLGNIWRFSAVVGANGGGADLVRSALLITAAVVAGLVIFPIVSFGLQPTLGTELAFTTLPTAFAAMPFGTPVAVAFFGLLFFAALSSAVSLLEVGVAAATTASRFDRRRATLALTGGVKGDRTAAPG